MHFIDQGLQTARELLWIHIPVAQPGMVVFPLAEPAVVHHEALDSDARSLSAKASCPASLTSKPVASQELYRTGRR